MKQKQSNQKSKLSYNYKMINTLFFVIDNSPVVLAHGMHSDLFTWNDFANKLAESGKDVWTIEITGGPNTECDNCTDYTYQDLTDYYWPALISGVVQYSGKTKIDYIGHSNGCRAALSSLNSYSNSGKNHAGNCFNSETGFYDIQCDFPILPVDNFFGIACPVTLNGNSYAGDTITKLVDGTPAGTIAINQLRNESKKHIYKKEFGKKISTLGYIFYFTDLYEDNYKISVNLQEFYNNLYIDNNTLFSGGNITVNKSIIIGGNRVPFHFSNKDNDGAVPISDMFILNNTINSSNKKLTFFGDTHSGLITNHAVINYVKGELK